LKEGSWEDEKLGSWEAEESLFVAGVILFMEAGKRGKIGRYAAFNPDFKEPEKTEPVFKISIIIPLKGEINSSSLFKKLLFYP
jgi:hypothetical protein